ncbi:Y-family DNA polymerase [Acetoanaerobium sticklandii]|uniref:Y-family DNA polymerase n=1 Tax=Acetoanaerobium sticklandii TaxID=1511 RepID=UPI003A9234B1
MGEDIDYSKLPRRDVLCIDVKSFFSSVEAVRRKIHPLDAYIIVISDFERPGAVVLASSPKVKKEFGIKTGSRKFQIPEDPKLMIVEPSMSLYLEINRRICDIFRRFVADEDLLVYSIDEAFLDISATRKLFGEPLEIARKIQKIIWDELKLVVSVGIGDNPLLAKLALDNEAKSNKSQIAYWSYENVPRTVWKIPKLTDMWGISYGYEKKLNDLGIKSVYELAHSNPLFLKSYLGIMGLQLYYHSWGVDYSRISEKVESKHHSYSKGQMLMRDYDSKVEIMAVLREMVEQICIRLRKYDMVCEAVSLYISFSKHEASFGFKKTKKLPRATNHTSEIALYFDAIFEENWRGELVRQINVSCEEVNPAEAYQLDLFGSIQSEKTNKIDNIIDEIREKYGKTSVFRAYNLSHGSTFLHRSGYVGGHKGASSLDKEEKK